MANMIDIVTVSRAITPYTQATVREELINYLKNGWTLFSTHYVGITGPELMMAYVFVKYDTGEIPQGYVNVDALSQDQLSAPAKKRGRPAKVQPVTEG